MLVVERETLYYVVVVVVDVVVVIVVIVVVVRLLPLPPLPKHGIRIVYCNVVWYIVSIVVS